LLFLLASVAEAIVDNDNSNNYSNAINFCCCELSNIAWAVAKLKLPLPVSALPLLVDWKAAEIALRESAKTVCAAILGRPLVLKRLPVMSYPPGFPPSVDWQVTCWITLPGQQQQQQSQLCPHEWSNTLWAYATSQCYNHYQELLQFVTHELLDTHPNLINSFKSQEIANTVWSVVTLLANKKNSSNSNNNNINATGVVVLDDGEQEVALMILRHAMHSVVQQLQPTQQQQQQPQSQQLQYPVFCPQDISNTAWSLATLGFSLGASTTTTMINQQSASLEAAQHNNYVVLKSGAADSDATLVCDFVHVLVPAAVPLLPRFGSQELNNLSWVLACLLSGSNNSDNNNNNNNNNNID